MVLGSCGAIPFASCDAAEKAEGEGMLIGSNIYGWTQYYQREKRALDIGEVVSALSDAGYNYLENFMDLARPENNAAFAEKLKARGMRPVSLYTGARLHETGKVKSHDRQDSGCCENLPGRWIPLHFMQPGSNRP